jgi:photosystem II stability/assembly factor-like uncharacterized protein
MENWELRRQQVERIVGTANGARLHDVLRAASEHVAAQRVARGTPTWEFAGPPNVPGRITALAIHRTVPHVLYAGTAGGGVFKTSDGGRSWTALWMREQTSLAIGGLAVFPSSPEVVYAATGEWEGKSSSTYYHHFAGEGAYVTRDGGVTWTPCGPFSSDPRRASAWTAAVAVHPENANVVFVAGDRALHRSTDGGRSWEEAYVDPELESRLPFLQPAEMNVPGAITDVVIDPDQPDLVFIGVQGRGVFRSASRGAPFTWAALAGSLPSGATVRAPKIALGPRNAAGQRFLAVLTDKRVFASADGGLHFAALPELQPEQSYVEWCTAIAVHPRNERIILAGHVYLRCTRDGGASGWEQHASHPIDEGDVHTDLQAIVFDPRDPAHIFVATDGGVWESRDTGQQWTLCSGGLFTAQCYTVAAARSLPLRLGITTQDQGAYIYRGDESPHLDPTHAWTAVGEWEGGWIDFDPVRSQTVYLDTRKGSQTDPKFFRRSHNDGDPPWDPMKMGDKFLQSDAKIREALAIARDRPSRMLLVGVAGDPGLESTGPYELFRRDGNAPWTAIPELGDVAAVEISADGHHAYAATADGTIHHSVEGGAAGTWTRLERGDLPVLPVNDIEIDPSNPRMIYLAFGNKDRVSAAAPAGESSGTVFGANQVAVWRGDLTGALPRWTPASGAGQDALPPRLPVTGLVIDPLHPEHLYASHLLGVHRSVDGGTSWTPMVGELPRTFVSDLDLHVADDTRTLYAATMGRGVYRCRLPM